MWSRCAAGVNTLRASATAAGSNPVLIIPTLNRTNNSTLVVMASGLDSPLTTQRGEIVVTNAGNIAAGLVGGSGTINRRHGLQQQSD